MGQMGRFIKKRSHKSGLPPGSLVGVGEHSETKITLLDYSQKHLIEKQLTNVEDCIPFRKNPSPTWIQIQGLHDVERLSSLGKAMGLHPLIMEDILNTDQRPKIEDFGNYLYVVLRMLSMNESGEVTADQISLVLGKNFVVSYEERPSPIFNLLRERLKNGRGRIRKMGADYLMYSLIDAVVDNYFTVIESIEDEIERIEEDLMQNPTQDTLLAINTMKREMIFLRKSLWPLREVIQTMERGDCNLIKDDTRIYLRDVYDHVIQILDGVESFREILSGMLDAYLSSVSHRLNEVMKVLTVITTVFMPLTFIAGIYGMNFHNMPELSWDYGYPLILCIMAIVAMYMLLKFKKYKWI
jgi:magnesium transporter